MIPVEKDKEYTIKIDSVSSDGNGVGHIDGFAVFVPLTAEGDCVRVKIVSVRKRFAHGVLVEIVEPSSQRCEPVCECYEACGGCQLRHIHYENQLKIKKNVIENALHRLGGFSDVAVDEVVGMEKPERYRNKTVFPVDIVDGELSCGFYAQQSHNIVPVADCLISDGLNSHVNNAVLDYMRENEVSVYDEDAHNGIVRRVFMRKSFSTGEIMVVISANTRELPHSENLVSKLRSISDKIVSIILNINTKKSNFVITDKNVTLWGSDRIHDTLCGIDFSISPQSFFQINPVQTEKLYSTALDFAQLDKSMSVMDIYCGIGTISLCAARQANRVIGVEIVERAIEDAKENASRNGIDNAEFYADSAENIVPKLIAHGESPNVIILDPPRKGSDEKTLTAIVKAQPKRIVYVSCNPATLARDARFLADRGYAVTKVKGFDLFPHTAHVECVVLMSRKDK